ncbi:IAA-alanine resistance protein 1 isoform X2 [Manihot esculenta]|uniref:Uncharacterized protein n=1 Tax=Manihot esculenta TaxID=3983 RepID=A0A2C9U673_MANES|nr:IAA-alanine resistance protein 1 isoform X2 [Manihot esculenta]
MLRGAFLHQLPHAFAGIALFLLVKEVIRYVEDNSNGAYSWSHHHHHHHRSSEKLKDDDDVNHVLQSQSPKETEEEVSDEVSDNSFNRDNFMENENLLFKVGDVGILVRSGFSVFRAPIFSVLSALVELAGVTFASLWGRYPGQ